MESKLGLNMELVNQARQSAAHVADDTQRFIDQHTTVTVERAVCRLLGIDGVNEMDVPLPNVVVDHMMATSFLPMGAAWAIGNAMIETGKDPQAVAEAIDKGELDLSKVPAHSDEEIRAAIAPVVNATVERINKNVAKRNAYLKEWGDKEGPYLYIIVATGNIYEDIIQAKAGAKQGADIIAVIRTTGQSLLDYVPYGATTEGFGGTYATQENFRLMRAALDEVGEEQHRYIRLCNYCSGLCMPEIAAMGALERLDVMLNDALYGILFRDINMQRTIVDQYFSRVINGYAGVIINTGEDNYLTTDDAITAAHTVLASQFLNEAFAKDAGMREEQMGLGHAFEMDPAVENTFLYELAQAQMAREIFPNAPLKYMPPTKFMTGNIFRGHIQDALFNMVTILTNQRLCLLGMMTEAIHTPVPLRPRPGHSRTPGLSSAPWKRAWASELDLREGGIMPHPRQRGPHQGHRSAGGHRAARPVRPRMEKGIFADVKRPRAERRQGPGRRCGPEGRPGTAIPSLEPMMKGRWQPE